MLAKVRREKEAVMAQALAATEEKKQALTQLGRLRHVAEVSRNHAKELEARVATLTAELKNAGVPVPSLAPPASVLPNAAAGGGVGGGAALAVGVIQPGEGAVRLAGEEGNQGGDDGADAPRGLPVLRVVRRHRQADLLAHREPAARVEQSDGRRLERVFGRQGDPAVIAAALEGGVRRSTDREVPLEDVVLQRRRRKVRAGTRLRDLRRVFLGGRA